MRGRRWGVLTAAGALAVPLALLSPAAEAVRGESVRLLLDVTPSGRTTTEPGFVLTYKVRVRAEGGIARKTVLTLTAGRPLSWTRHSPACTRSGPDLRCPLGDVDDGSHERIGTVRVPDDSGRPRSILVAADAANAPRAALDLSSPASSASDTPPGDDLGPAADPPGGTPSDPGSTAPCAGDEPCPVAEPSGPEPRPRSTPGGDGSGYCPGGESCPTDDASPPTPIWSGKASSPSTSGRPGGSARPPRSSESVPSPSIAPSTPRKTSGSGTSERPDGPTHHTKPSSSAPRGSGEASGPSTSGRPSGSARPPRPSGSAPSPSVAPSESGSGGAPAQCAGGRPCPDSPSEPRPSADLTWTPPGGSRPSASVPEGPGGSTDPADEPSIFGPGDEGAGPGGPPGSAPEPEIAPGEVPESPGALPPGAGGVVLPPVTAPASPPEAGGRTRMTLMAPARAGESDTTDWAIVIGVALIAEIGLLWGASCIGLWRRRIALERARAAQSAG